jgi:hypothetical protein
MADDPLSYYSGVGRGKGTILQSPNLVPLFQQALKYKAAQQQAGQTDAERQKMWLDKAVALGDKGWIRDAEYLDNLKENFTNKYVAIMQKYDGQKIPAALSQELINEANKYRFIAQNSQKQRDEYYDFAMKLANTNLDPQSEEEAAQILQQWADTPTNERTDINGFYLEKKFDYIKFSSSLATLINKEALQKAENSGINITSAGKFTDTKTYKWTTLPVATKYVMDAFNTNKMYARDTGITYENWKKTQEENGNTNYNVTYTYYNNKDASGNTTKSINELQETVQINNVEDYLRYVTAPALVSMQERENVQMGNVVSIGVTTTTPSGSGGFTDPQQYTATRKTMSGSINFPYYAYKIDVNPSSKQASTANIFQPSTGAFKISSDKDRPLSSSTNYVVDNAAVDFLPVATQTITLGPGMTVQPGTRLIDINIPGVNFLDWLKNNKDKWQWQANYNIHAKDSGNEVFDIYEDVDDNPTYSGTLSDVTLPDGTKMHYIDYIKLKEKEYNDMWGTTGASSRASGGTGGARPPYDSKIHGSYANYKKMYP